MTENFKKIRRWTDYDTVSNKSRSVKIPTRSYIRAETNDGRIYECEGPNAAEVEAAFKVMIEKVIKDRENG